jgi:hypothetical protein
MEDLLVRVQDDTLISGADEKSDDAMNSVGMGPLGTCAESSGLMDGVRNLSPR